MGNLLTMLSAVLSNKDYIEWCSKQTSSEHCSEISANLELPSRKILKNKMIACQFKISFGFSLLESDVLIDVYNAYNICCAAGRFASFFNNLNIEE